MSRQARQDAGDGLLRHVLRPVAMHRADDLELRVSRATPSWMPAEISSSTKTPARPRISSRLPPSGSFFGEIHDLVLAHLLEVDGDAPGAGFGDDAVEGDDGDAGVAGFLDGAVERGRRGGVDDDGVIALQDHVLDLRGLLGHLVLGGGEGVGRGDDAGLDGFAR